jgi:pinin/SDK/memA/ protein conserved region
MYIHPHSEANSNPIRSSIIVQSTVMRPQASPPPQSQSEDSATTTSKRPLSPTTEKTDSTENNSLKRRRLSTDQARGKRMFGALMGTLTSFQKQTSKDSKSVLERRAEIDARVKERVAREKEEMAVIKERTDRERKEQEDQQRIKFENEIVLLLPPRLWLSIFLVVYADVLIEGFGEFGDVGESSSSSYTI